MNFSNTPYLSVNSKKFGHLRFNGTKNQTINDLVECIDNTQEVLTISNSAESFCIVSWIGNDELNSDEFRKTLNYEFGESNRDFSTLTQRINLDNGQKNILIIKKQEIEKVDNKYDNKKNIIIITDGELYDSIFIYGFFIGFKNIFYKIISNIGGIYCFSNSSLVTALFLSQITNNNNNIELINIFENIFNENNKINTGIINKLFGRKKINLEYIKDKIQNKLKINLDQFSLLKIPFQVLMNNINKGINEFIELRKHTIQRIKISLSGKNSSLKSGKIGKDEYTSSLYNNTDENLFKLIEWYELKEFRGLTTKKIILIISNSKKYGYLKKLQINFWKKNNNSSILENSNVQIIMNDNKNIEILKLFLKGKIAGKNFDIF